MSRVANSAPSNVSTRRSSFCLSGHPADSAYSLCSLPDIIVYCVPFFTAMSRLESQQEDEWEKTEQLLSSLQVVSKYFDYISGSLLNILSY
jgi:hypothetical protein